MGGDKKRKHKSRRDSYSGSDSSTSSSSSDSESERRHKHKDKHKKHKKHKKEDKREKKRLVKEAEAFLKQQLAGGGGPSAPPPPLPRTGPAYAPVPNIGAVKEALTEEDYFLRNPEFSFWLLEARHKHFNELMSDETRSLFREFVTDWNEGRLAEKYYAGLVAAPPRRTGHQWSFKGAAGGGGRPSGGGSMTAFMDEQRERREAERLAARQSDKAERSAWRRDQKELLDELLPKATGREAKVEARLARREEARAREASPDLVGPADLLGGRGDDSLASARAREARRQEVRGAAQAARREELAAKAAAAAAAEDAKMAAFRALVAQGPITIAKRQ